MSMSKRAAAAVVLSLLVSGGLAVRIVAINKPAVVVIILPAIAGALLAIWKRGRVALWLSASLTALTAMVSLIGGVGLLYVPSIALFIWSAASAARPAGQVVGAP